MKWLLTTLAVVSFSQVFGQLALPYTANFDGLSSYSSSISTSPPILPTGWTMTQPSGSGLVWNAVNSGSFPTTTPHSGNGMMGCDGWYSGSCCGSASATHSNLATPMLAFGGSPSNPVQVKVSFWMTQDNSSYTPTNYVEGINTYYSSTTSTATGATFLGFSSRSNTSVSGSNGVWTNVTYIFTTTMASGYIIFDGQSNDGDDFFMDDVSVMAATACTGTPSAATITSGVTTTALCSGSTVTLSATDANFSTNMQYKWQQASSATGPWTTIAGATGLNFTTPGLFDTTYFREVDSCPGSGLTTPSTNIYMVPIQKVSLPYLETFNTTASGTVPSCYTYNDNYGTNWTVRTDIHAADGTPMIAMRDNDPTTNAAYGKNNYFTLPGIKMQSGTVYAIRFKYARGKSAPVTNTGTAYPEHLQVYAGPTPPNYQLSNVTSGSLLFDQTITVDNVLDTTIYYSPSTSGGNYISWYTNTPHPAGGSSVAGGIVIVDSIYVNTGTCVAPAITSQPTAVAGCVGAPVTLSVATTGTANTYQWKKAGTNITGATGSTYKINNPATSDAGTYTVVVTNPCGTVTSNNITLTINAKPTPGITPNTATTMCSASALLTGSGGTSYQWQLNGSNINNATNATYNPTATGNYRVVVTNANGCSDTSVTDAITINTTPPSTIIATGPTSFCQGGNVALNANVGAYHYSWLYNGAPVSGDTTTTLTAYYSGLYRVIVSTNNCADTSAATTVTAVQPPPASITAVGSTSFCAGSGATLVAPTGPGYTYQWRLNNNNINATSASYTATAAGNYSVIVALNSCADTSLPIAISQNPSPAATITAGGATAICAGNGVMLNANNDSTYTYQWLYNGSATGVTTPSYSATNGGNYQVSVTSSNGCTTTSSATIVTVNSLPAATITAGGPTTFCAGGSVTFDASLGNGYSYLWYNNGAPTAVTGASYTANTSSSVSVKITDANGCSNTSAATDVVVNTPPTITIDTTGQTSFCPGLSVTFTAIPATGFTYQWRKNGANIPGATTSTYTASTSGNITVVGTDMSTGCSSTSAATDVIEHPLPSATIGASGPLTFCPGTTLTLSVPFVAGTSYVWTDNGGYFSNQNSISVSNTGSFKITVTDSNGCVNTSATTNTTLLNSVAAAVTAQGNTSFCPGQSVILSANAATGVTYQWMLNNLPIANATDSQYTATQDGDYTVTMSNAACSATSTATTVTVYPAPAASIAANGDLAICINGGSVTLSTAATAGDAYQWQMNGNNLGGATNNSYAADTVGIFDVVVTNTFGCATTSQSLGVTALPAPNASITAITGTSVCQGDTVRMYESDATAGNGESYQWAVNGTDIAGATTAAYRTTTGGTYTVTVTGINGCTTTSAGKNVTINPAPAPAVTANNNILSTGSFTNYQWYLDGQAIEGATSQSYQAVQNGTYTVAVTDAGGCSGTSAGVYVDDLAVKNITGIADNISIYPNPTAGVAHIAAPIAVHIQICSLDGKVVMESNSKDINISDLANAVYMIRIMDEQGQLIKTDKLIKAGY